MMPDSIAVLILVASVIYLAYTLPRLNARMPEVAPSGETTNNLEEVENV